MVSGEGWKEAFISTIPKRKMFSILDEEDSLTSKSEGNICPSTKENNPGTQENSNPGTQENSNPGTEEISNPGTEEKNNLPELNLQPIIWNTSVKNYIDSKKNIICNICKFNFLGGNF